MQFIRNNAFHREYLLARYPNSYPENRANIEPYYFQAALAVRKLVEEKNHKLRDFFDLSVKYNNFNYAFIEAFGKTPDRFLENISKEINNFFQINIYVGIMALTWSLFPVFLIIAHIKKSKKTRELLAQWDAEENLEACEGNES
jgi:hypothetical protein